jgi:hypothetical protein
VRYLDDDLIVQCSLTPVSTRKLKRLFVLLVRPSIWGGSGGHGGGNRRRGRKCYCRGSRRDCSALQGRDSVVPYKEETVSAEETVVHYKEAPANALAAIGEEAARTTEKTLS